MKIIQFRLATRKNMKKEAMNRLYRITWLPVAVNTDLTTTFGASTVGGNHKVR